MRQLNWYRLQVDPRGIFLPSPIVHSTAGYVIYRFTKRNMPEVWKKRVGPVSLFLVITLVFSNLPDLDAFAGLIMGDFRQYHNNGTHSLIVALLVAIAFGLAFSWKRRGEFVSWFLLILASYSSHILLDFFTRGGRGVMLFWPFSTERFQSRLPLFFGVHWSDGLLSVNHLWTVGTELIFVVILLLIAYLAETRTYRVTEQENI